MSHTTPTSRGFRLGRIAGIPVELDPTLLLIAGLLTMALRANFETRVADAPEWVLWLTAFGAALIFLVSVLVHELSHSLVATRRGVAVRRIRLFLFGGVSEISREASRARDEFAISVVGPGSSMVLAVLFFVGSLLVPEASLVGAAFGWLATINLILGIFNLLPGLPLDGGRLLRAAIWHRTGDVRRASRVAATVGTGLGLLLAGSGFVLFPVIGFAALWNVFIGWYLYQGALSARAHADLQAIPDRLTAADVMQPQGEYVTPALPVSRLLDTREHVSDDTWFPVIDAWGEPRGAVAMGTARRAWERNSTHLTVADVMVALSASDVLPVTTPIRQLLGLLRNRDQVFLLMKDESPAGVLTALHLERWISAAR